MKKKNKPYFHELGQNEIDALIAEKRTFGYVIENYNQTLIKICTT
jgi:hypothetical protein